MEPAVIMNAPTLSKPLAGEPQDPPPANRCAHCAGKFGLIRHARAAKQFCSARCVEAYLRALPAKAADKRRVGAFTPIG